MPPPHHPPPAPPTGPSPATPPPPERPTASDLAVDLAEHQSDLAANVWHSRYGNTTDQLVAIRRARYAEHLLRNLYAYAYHNGRSADDAQVNREVRELLDAIDNAHQR